MTGVVFFDIDSFQLEEGVVATEYERPAPAPDYPIEIHSLNDFDIISQKSEGGTYEGRNLLEGNWDISWDDDRYAHNGYNYLLRPTIDSIKEKVSIGDTLTFSLDVWAESNFALSIYDSNGNPGMSFGREVISVKKGTQRVSFTSTLVRDNTRSGTWYFDLYNSNNGVKFSVSNIKIEKGTEATDWTPAPEDIEESDNHPLIDKINILMDEPLRSVGDVKDRLFRDSDGIWKIERNLKERLLDGSESWTAEGKFQSSQNYAYIGIKDKARGTNIIVSSLPYETYSSQVKEGWSTTSVFIINLKNERTGVLPGDSISERSVKFRNWVRDNPFTIVYETSNPLIEILSQSLQDKLNNLRSFKGSNYVYTVDNNNLKPNLNVVFKSKGWKHKQATDNLETDVSNKADKSDVESGFSDVNESIDEFRNNYESYQDSVAKSMEDASTELQKALERTSIIEANLGEGAADWIFTHTQIRMSDEGVMIGQKEAGSYLQISDNQISFFNGSEDPVAFINGGMLHINHAIFVESIQISGFMISSEIKDHITFRYVGN